MDIAINDTSMTKVYAGVVKIIVDQLGIEEEEVTPETRFDEIEDSLALVEMVMTLEEEFASGAKTLQIPEEDVMKLEAVRDVLDYLYGVGINDATYVSFAERHKDFLESPEPATA
jgi:acyl carrier protein